jgi:predicted amidohydrolase
LWIIHAGCEWWYEKYSLAGVKETMIVNHEKMTAQAGKKGVQVLGLHELFCGLYFCAEQNARWYKLTGGVPTRHTLARMQKLAKKRKMVLVIPISEIEMAGVFYNTAAQPGPSIATGARTKSCPRESPVRRKPAR